MTPREEKKMNLTIHIATIGHRHGIDNYVGLTEADVNAQVAKFVREWWDDAFTPGDEPDVPEDDEKAVELYFEAQIENGGDEYMNTGTAELVGSGKLKLVADLMVGNEGLIDATAGLIEAAQDIVKSADDLEEEHPGEDLTVTSTDAVERLRKLVEGLPK
jgi:hypothetical protein